ncbi:MAG: hypothetical protein K0R08_225 [Solimicrobium sp.]|jgi:hypothetical protein|nr:hypothetical protein [Solimicrobium sp.]
MENIFTDNPKSIKEVGLALYNNLPNMQPTKKLLTTFAAYPSATSPPTTEPGQIYGITKENIIVMASIVVPLLITGAVGLGFALYYLYQKRSIESELINNQSSEEEPELINDQIPDVGDSRKELNINEFLSSNEDLSPEGEGAEIVNCSESTYLRAQPSRSNYDAVTTFPFGEIIDITSDVNIDRPVVKSESPGE